MTSGKIMSGQGHVKWHVLALGMLFSYLLNLSYSLLISIEVNLTMGTMTAAQCTMT